MEGVNNIWGIPIEKKVVLELNSCEMPLGTSGKKFRKLDRKYVWSRKFIGLSAPHWKRIEKDKNEQIWKVLDCIDLVQFVTLSILIVCVYIYILLHCL